MDGLARLDCDELVRRMREDFERTMREVADAVNDAPDGHLIDGSEERVRDLLGEFRRRSFEAAAQMRVEATEASAAFSPVKQGLARHGLARRSMLSCNGRVELRRRRYQSKAGRTDAPVDELIDQAGSGVSLAVREMSCRIATDSGSFTRAAANLDRLAQLKLSEEKLRQLAESEGRAVLAWQEQEQLELDFDAASCLTDKTRDGTTRSRVYVGIDGFMLPVVTDAETGRRFEKAVIRRQSLPRRRGVRRPRLKRGCGADQRYKEMKRVAIYDQEKEHRLVRATRRGVKQAAGLLRQMSQDVRLRRAGQVAAVTDGAEWIARLIEANLPADTTVILDYFHASQHVHQARRANPGKVPRAIVIRV